MPRRSDDRTESELADRTLAEVDEDEVLDLILPFLGVPGAGQDVVWVGPGDDAAVVHTRGRTVVTTDTMVRGRDWRDDWSAPSDVGVKLVAQNLADVAAMGAVPSGIVVTLVADPATGLAWVAEFARGVGEAAASARVAVLGGDLSSAPAGTLVVSVTALGELVEAAPVLRSGAQVGDTVAVCGSLGMSAAGLLLLSQGRAGDLPDAVAVHRRPSPPLAAGPAAARAGAHAMLDISDGLVRDGRRIATASRVRLDLSRELLTPDVCRLAPVLGEPAAWDCVLGGGEEHALLATFPGDLPAGWRPIGRVEEGAGVTLDGMPAPAVGWDHFGRGARESD